MLRTQSVKILNPLFDLLSRTSVPLNHVVNRTVVTKVESIPKGPNVVLIDGARTPFVISGTDFKDQFAYELQRHALLYVEVPLFFLFYFNLFFFFIC